MPLTVHEDIVTALEQADWPVDVTIRPGYFPLPPSLPAIIVHVETDVPVSYATVRGESVTRYEVRVDVWCRQTTVNDLVLPPMKAAELLTETLIEAMDALGFTRISLRKQQYQQQDAMISIVFRGFLTPDQTVYRSA